MNGIEEPLTEVVIGAAIEVHRHLGPGLLESVYHKCLAYELASQDLEFISKSKLPIQYKGHLLIDEALEIDIYFPNRLIVELKSVDRLHSVHEAQLLTYMRLTRTRVGLLINFNERALVKGITRRVL